MNTETMVVPEDLAQGIKQVAERTGLSVGDALRESIRVGLRSFGSEEEDLKPFNAVEARLAFCPDPEWDPLEAAMARIPIRPEQE